MISFNFCCLVVVVVIFSFLFMVVVVINSVVIVFFIFFFQCFEYKVVGICYWLFCGLYGCKVKMLVKVCYYVFDVVVFSYVNIGSNFWMEVLVLGILNFFVQVGNDVIINYKVENSIGCFKEVDVIGYFGGVMFSWFVSVFGYVCFGVIFLLVLYFFSILDVIGWWYGIFEQVYFEVLVLGLCEVGGIFFGDMWGNFYLCSGFLYQIDDYKMVVVIVQCVGDIIM